MTFWMRGARSGEGSVERLETNFSPRDITSVSEGVTVHPERLTTVFKVSVLGFGVVVGRGP